MQVLKTKNNPWTIEQRTIIAGILNDALTLSVDAAAIVGCVTSGDKCLVIWNYGIQRHTFWFDLEWFRSRVEHETRKLEVVKECASRGLKVEPVMAEEKVYIISSHNAFVGCIGCSENGWYVVRSGGNGCPIPTANLADAVLSLWMLEVAVVAA